MAQGRDYLLFISSDGTSSGTETEVELQGDLTINPGKSTNTTVYKNGQSTTVNDSGFTASLNMGNSAPLGAGESLVWAAHDSTASTYFWIRNANTGGLEWAFSGKAAIQTLGTPVNGEAAVSVTIGADGAVTRSTKAAS